MFIGKEASQSGSPSAFIIKFQRYLTSSDPLNFPFSIDRLQKLFPFSAQIYISISNPIYSKPCHSV